MVITWAWSVALLAACDDAPADDTAGGGPVDASTIDASSSAFAPFAAKTRVIGVDDSIERGVVLAATDAAGPIACSLGMATATPAGAAASVLAKFDAPSELCPVGTYALDARGSRCSDSAGPFRANCAIYRRWDESGAEVARTFATGGGARITQQRLADSRIRCTAEIELLFPGGGRWAETIAIDYAGFESPPLCTHDTCGASCEPWQTCSDRGTCEDVGCVEAGSACPGDGSPACCVFSDRDLACNESPSQGTRTCCVEHVGDCRYDSDCCAPYHCTLNQLGTYTCL